MFGLTAFGDVLIGAAAFIAGVYFADKVIWLKDAVVSAYSWIRAKL